METQQDLIIIGAGVAGLAAGSYARMNGYTCHIFEMHNLPGGLCTSWKRRGFVLEGCIHWLVGSGASSSMYRMWSELGLVQGRAWLNHDQLMRMEFDDGETLVLYVDPARLREHLLTHSPADRLVIEEMVLALRVFSRFNAFPDKPQDLMNTLDGVVAAARFLPWLPPFLRWGRLSVGDFAARFKSRRIQSLLNTFFSPDMPLMFLLLTMAWLHKGEAGYPIGGSLPMAKTLEKRFLDLGGQVSYKSRVTRILTENNRAAGVVLEDGSIHRAARVISAADSFTTIYKLLDGRFTDESVDSMFKELTPFPALVMVGLGLHNWKGQIPVSVNGLSLPLGKPIDSGGRTQERIVLHTFDFDPTMAPAGKAAAQVLMEADYDFWKDLSRRAEAYQAEKLRIGQEVLQALTTRFPDLEPEVLDVATPMTWERYTGNWRGSFEGWLPTVANFRRRLPRTLPGLEAFRMIGQWTEIGGGLPPAAFSGRHAVQILCHEDGRKFRTTLP